MSKKIFILDDDDDFLNITSKVLAHMGELEVVTSSDSVNAIEMIKREKPDIVLLDIMMPKVDGLTITKNIRSTPELSHIKIVVYSAKIFDADRKNALKLGADEYISKVIESSKLVETIHRVLNSKS